MLHTKVIGETKNASQKEKGETKNKVENRESVTT